MNKSESSKSQVRPQAAVKRLISSKDMGRIRPFTPLNGPLVFKVQSNRLNTGSTDFETLQNTLSKISSI